MSAAAPQVQCINCSNASLKDCFLRHSGFSSCNVAPPWEAFGMRADRVCESFVEAKPEAVAAREKVLQRLDEQDEAWLKRMQAAGT